MLSRRQYVSPEERDWDNIRDWAPHAKVGLWLIMVPVGVMYFVSKSRHSIRDWFLGLVQAEPYQEGAQ